MGAWGMMGDAVGGKGRWKRAVRSRLRKELLGPPGSDSAEVIVSMWACDWAVRSYGQSSCFWEKGKRMLLSMLFHINSLGCSIAILQEAGCGSSDQDALGAFKCCFSGVVFKCLDTALILHELMVFE